MRVNEWYLPWSLPRYMCFTYQDQLNNAGIILPNTIPEISNSATDFSFPERMQMHKIHPHVKRK